jgi:hypothetical protein
MKVTYDLLHTRHFSIFNPERRKVVGMLAALLDTSSPKIEINPVFRLQNCCCSRQLTTDSGDDGLVLLSN